MRYLLPIFALMALLSWATPPAKDDVSVRVVAVSDDTVIVAPFVAPTLKTELEKGIAPGEGEVLTCREDEESVSFNDHDDKNVLLVCGGRTLRIRGIGIR